MKILLCVTGGIAAYKSLELVRLFKQENDDVYVAMTEAACQFIAPLSFQILSNHSVAASLSNPTQDKNVEHIILAQEIDLILVAPATANIIGKFANGIADDLVSTILSAADVPVIFAPSMNDKMWANVFFQENLMKLKKKGFHIIEPGKGFLACGSYGKGRMAETEKIFSFVKNLFSAEQKKTLTNQKVLITAGATREYIDSFRYITNASSGKMGLALANAFFQEGATVSMICADIKVSIPAFIPYDTAKTTTEMRELVLACYEDYDIIIMASAISDYKPKSVSNKKIKENHLQLDLEKNIDILAEIGKRKKKHQILIGFSAEDENLLVHAAQKLKKKNLNLIIANLIGEKNTGFESDNNTYSIISKKETTAVTNKSKETIAQEIVEKLKKSYFKKNE